MFGLGPLELGIILAIVVVLFGAKRLPELGSGIGKAQGRRISATGTGNVWIRFGDKTGWI